jgi:hypothetical protein
MRRAENTKKGSMDKVLGQFTIMSELTTGMRKRRAGGFLLLACQGRATGK